jgi:hypothetical protein
VTQSLAVSSRDVRPKGRTQSSLRTPVVPSKKRGYEFEDDIDEDEE